MKYVSGIVALLLVFNCDGIDLGKFYAGRPGSQGSGSSGGGSGGDGSSNVYLTVTTSHDPFARNPLMGQSHHSLPHPQSQYRESNYRLDAMTPQHYVGFFAMKGWTQDRALSNPTWYMYDNYVVIAKQCPKYIAYIDKYYNEYKEYGPLSKGLGRITGSYTPGLADRFARLKKENDLFLEHQRDVQLQQFRIQEEQEAWCVTKQTFQAQHALLEAVFADCGTVYKNNSYEVLNCNDRLEKREYAFECITTEGALYAKESYTISQDVRTLIETSCSPGKYTKCYGNQLQHVIHQDCIDLLDQTVAMPLHCPLREHTPALVELIDAAREYNQAGECTNAIEVSDLCCSLLVYGQAIAQGAVQGLAGVVAYSIDHPIETVAMAVASEAVLAYQLIKVVHDVAKIGITYACDRAQGAQQAAEYIAPITDLIDALANNKMTGPQVAQGAVQFAVGWIAHNKLLGGLGKLYGGVRTKAQTFFKKNPTATLQEYVQTTEGQLLRVVSPETEQGYEQLVQLSKQHGQKSGFPKKGVKTKKLTMEERRQLYKEQQIDKSKYTYEHGIAQQADINPKHTINSKNGTSKVPLGEQEALDHSVPIGGESKSRVGVSKGQLVVFQDSNIVVDGKRYYHGYVVDNIDSDSFGKARKELERLGKINSKGEPIKI